MPAHRKYPPIETSAPPKIGEIRKIAYPKGIKDDNRLENLQLLPTVRFHIPSTRWQQEVNKLNERIRQVEARITLIEAENVLLRKELGDKAPSY